MAGEGLLDIKRRIRSIRNTQKITRAMGLVATVKVRKMRERAEKAAPFYEAFRGSAKYFSSNLDIMDSVYFTKNNSDTDLYIVITSDSGLCGSYNANVINSTLEHMYGKKVVVITIGERGKSFFLRNNYETLAEFVEIGDEPSYKEAREIISVVLKAYRASEVGNVFLVYTKFHSPVKQSVEILKLLPLEIEAQKREILMEPSSMEVMNHIVPSYLNSMIFYGLVNGVASEYSIRMSAMDNATRNAGKILDKLNLAYNRARQSNITQEITEIVSGAEALKD